MKVIDENELTPVHEIGGMFFKREDLFMPFKNSNINGGKVRQCLELIKNNQKLIESSCNSTIATYTSVTSPQGLIVATCAEQFGFKAITAIATSNKETALRKNKILRLTSEISELRIIAESGQNSKGMQNKLHDSAKAEKFFCVDFGMNSADAMRPVINQCENIPDELDYLIVPSGSCITLAAIAEGVKLFGKKVGKVIGIQIHGYDRNKTIKKFTNGDYKLIPDKTYKEWTLLKNYQYENLELDAVYESRAFEWLIKRSGIDYKNSKTLFWIVANFNGFRF